MTRAILTLASFCLGISTAASTQTPPPAPPAPAPAASPPAPVAQSPAPPTRARTARPINPGQWITQDDYPIGALANAQSGTVGFRVQVSPEGLVTGCTVIASSGWPLLDEWTCRMISERARFTAALDARGRPTTGTYANRIQWRLPPPEPTVPAAPAPAPVPPR